LKKVVEKSVGRSREPMWWETWHVCNQSTPFVDAPATDPALLRILTAAGLPATGRFHPKAGWVSRAWVGDEYVVRLNTDGRHRDAYRHEAAVVELLAGSAVP